MGRTERATSRDYEGHASKMNRRRYSILLIEDNPLDAELAEQCLRNSGLDFDMAVADCRDKFVHEFANRSFDLILADYSLPDFNGNAALDIVRAEDRRLPFIFVSGVLGEDVAVETMLRGATDYVIKQKLERLVPAVMRALSEREAYLLREKAENDLKAAEANAQANARRQTLLLELLQRQRVVYDAERLMLAAAEALGRHLGIDRTGFFQFTSDGRARFAGVWGAGTVAPLADEYLDFQTIAPERIEAYRRSEIAVSCNVHSHGDAQRLISNEIRAFVVAPIFRHGVWEGGFFATHSSAREWTSEEVAFVKEIGDITWDSVERAGAVAELEASEQRLRTAAETANLGSWDLDLETGQMTCSDQCKLHFGRSIEVGFNYPDLQASIHADDREAVARAMRTAIEDHEIYRAEYRNIWPDGSVHWVVVAGRAHYDQSGRARRITGFTLDATERHKAQMALLQSEKLAAVGRLASSIAHEINNPLESVTNLLFLAARSEDMPEIKDYLNTAEQELRRVSAIANQTLRFHRQASGPKAVTSKDLFDGVLSMYQGRFLNSGIKISMRIRDRQTIHCLDGEIRQVLNNLVANAIDAMQSAGGCLALRSHDTTMDNGEPGVTLMVADTGCGMSFGVRDKAFDAFFTTKGSNGTGLGLWISKEIIDRHNGQMRFYSSQRPERHGTVCTVTLPCAAHLTS